MNKIINILQHAISYYYNNDQAMPAHEQEHVRKMIMQGYNQGELNDSNDEEHIRGWWGIVI